MNKRMWNDEAKVGFTLIELLVVVAIISLLVAILLPALNNARENARAIKCAAAIKSVGQAVAQYTSEYSFYPPSYLYASDANGSYDLYHQPDNPNTYGYIHWSWLLFNQGRVGKEAFQCSDIPNGGIPRTNPGPNSADWENGQVDVQGGTAATAGSLEDKQVPRIALTANAAIMPRNKFSSNVQESGVRLNKLVRESEIESPSTTILAAEFNKNWKAITAQSPANLVKSHRPINPFYNISSGWDEYGAPTNAFFVYGDGSNSNYGLAPSSALENVAGLIDGAVPPVTNAIGRHHSGGDTLGGTTNFLFCDGHVERLTVLTTMQKRLWGNRYYSLTGNNEVK